MFLNARTQQLLRGIRHASNRRREGLTAARTARQQHARNTWALPALNNYSQALQPGQCVRITTALITPAQNLDHFTYHPGVKVDSPLADTNQPGLGIVAEQIAAGAIGKVVLAGVAMALVDITDARHGFADVVDGSVSQWQSNWAGPCQILWKPSGTGVKKCLVRLDNYPPGGCRCFNTENQTLYTAKTGNSLLNLGQRDTQMWRASDTTNFSIFPPLNTRIDIQYPGLYLANYSVSIRTNVGSGSVGTCTTVLSTTRPTGSFGKMTFGTDPDSFSTPPPSTFYWDSGHATAIIAFGTGATMSVNLDAGSMISVDVDELYTHLMYLGPVPETEP